MHRVAENPGSVPGTCICVPCVLCVCIGCVRSVLFLCMRMFHGTDLRSSFHQNVWERAHGQKGDTEEEGRRGYSMWQWQLYLHCLLQQMTLLLTLIVPFGSVVASSATFPYFGIPLYREATILNAVSCCSRRKTVSWTGRGRLHN